MDIKSRGIWWRGLVACLEGVRISYKNLFGKPETRRALRRHSS
jgi:hypothetical protein